MKLSQEVVDLAEWLESQINNYKYADINTMIRIHDGRISLIERSATEKIKPTGIIGGQKNEHRGARQY